MRPFRPANATTCIDGINDAIKRSFVEIHWTPGFMEIINLFEKTNLRGTFALDEHRTMFVLSGMKFFIFHLQSFYHETSIVLDKFLKDLIERL